MSNPKFTSISVTPEARDALRRLTVFMSASVSKRMSMSDAILTAEKMAFRHDLSIPDCAAEAGIVDAPNGGG